MSATDRLIDFVRGVSAAWVIGCFFDDWLQFPTWNSIVEMLYTGGVIATVSISAYFLTAKRCYRVFHVLGGCLLAVLVAVAAAYRLDWIDLKFNLSGKIDFDSVAANCERALLFALSAILLALPIAMRRGKPQAFS